MARSELRKRRFAAAAVGALGLPLAMLGFACNDLIGLSDFEKVECPGPNCEGTDGGPDAPFDVRQDVDSGPLPDAEGTAPVSWARWRMPNSVPPYDAGHDADNVVTYALVADGRQDDITKLVWRHPGGDKPIKYDEAKAACAALPNGPWRLPSRIELVSLLDMSRAAAPFIDPTFDGTLGGLYWTTSEVRPFGAAGRQRWTVDFQNGGVGKADEASGVAYPRCVKGGT